VQQEGPKYRISLQPFRCFSRPVWRMDLRQAAMPSLEQLWKDTGESCYLAILDEDRALFIEHLDGTRDVRANGRVGGRYLLHCCAPGKVLLANADATLLAKLTEEGFTQNTTTTICDLGALEQELEDVRTQHFGLDLEEYSRGMMCFAAPIFDHTDSVVGSVGISALTLHYTPTELVAVLGAKVLRAAAETSQRLGAGPHIEEILSQTPRFARQRRAGRRRKTRQEP
jgi:DNA-binding IclR family transcriptional regulator